MLAKNICSNPNEFTKGVWSSLTRVITTTLFSFSVLSCDPILLFAVDFRDDDGEIHADDANPSLVAVGGVLVVDFISMFLSGLFFDEGFGLGNIGSVLCKDTEGLYVFTVVSGNEYIAGVNNSVVHIVLFLDFLDVVDREKMDGYCSGSAGIQMDIFLFVRPPAELLDSTGIGLVLGLYLNSLAKEWIEIFSSMVQKFFTTAVKFFSVAVVCANAVGEFSDDVFHIVSFLLQYKYTKKSQFNC